MEIERQNPSEIIFIYREDEFNSPDSIVIKHFDDISEYELRLSCENAIILADALKAEVKDILMQEIEEKAGEK